jgi:hypothetical protein
MGVYLSTPCKEVNGEEGKGNKLHYAVGEMQGWRKNMEDSHIASLNLEIDQISALPLEKRLELQLGLGLGLRLILLLILTRSWCLIDINITMSD